MRPAAADQYPRPPDLEGPWSRSHSRNPSPVAQLPGQHEIHSRLAAHDVLFDSSRPPRPCAFAWLPVVDTAWAVSRSRTCSPSIGTAACPPSAVVLCFPSTDALGRPLSFHRSHTAPEGQCRVRPHDREQTLSCLSRPPRRALRNPSDLEAAKRETTTVPHTETSTIVGRVG